MNRITKLVSISAIALLSACTQPGQTTAVGAGTGAVIGAGLGAIVGNQTGSTGTGLVLGAAAGAAAGGAVGNALEAHDKKFAEHDEAIARKDETIKSQQAQIAQLRSMRADDSAPANQPYGNYAAKGKHVDSYAWNRSEGAGVRYATPQEIAAAKSGLRSAPTEAAPRAQLNTSASSIAPSLSRTTSSVTEKNLVEEVRPEPVKPQLQPKSEPATTTASLATSGENDDCKSAEGEVTKANIASDSADKLFHLRRALRMCSGNAPYHNQLGELYLTLNRSDDAKFEFNEALKIDPSNESARSNLARINTPIDTAKSGGSKGERY